MRPSMPSRQSMVRTPEICMWKGTLPQICLKTAFPGIYTSERVQSWQQNGTCPKLSEILSLVCRRSLTVTCRPAPYVT